MRQSVFTIIAPVRDVDALRAVLEPVGADPAENDVLPLGLLGRAHLASLAIRRGDRPLLVFELNVDGSIDDAIGDLVGTPELAAGIAAIFGTCAGWPGAGPEAYLRDHVVRPAAHHIGNTGRSRPRIEDERDLVDVLETVIDDARDDGTLPPTRPGVADLVRNRANAAAAWVGQRPGPDIGLLDWIRRGIGLVPAVVPALGIVVTLPYLVKVVEPAERRNWEPPQPVDLDLAAELEVGEDLVGSIQNHMMSVVPIRPGRYRRFVLRSVLFVIDRLARTVFTRGRLGSIATIHFAHWSIIDDGDSLLFLSNFDGSWESYLDDFIEKVQVGLTAVWSNCVGFPPARTLIHEGATHGPEFKAWARTSMHPTLVWYQAYPTLGVTDIDRNSRIRRGLRRRWWEWRKDEERWLSEL